MSPLSIAIAIDRGITKGKIELPLVWDSSLPPEQQQSNQITVILEEPIYDTEGKAIFDRGSVAIVEVQSINDANGLVTAYVSQIDDTTFNPGELILRNKKKAALVAKASLRSNFGKITLLDFTEAGEYITFIAPSDRSQFVYNTDLPANSGEAQSVYLLPIKKVDFKGTYQTSHPNLIVKTINSSGQSKQYNFILNFSSSVMTSTGIKIINSIEKPFSDPNQIRVSAGQSIDADYYLRL